MNKIYYLGFILVVSFASACKSVLTVQKKELYDQTIAANTNEINGFKAIDVFYDDFDKSVWASPEKQCVQLTSENKNVFSGKSALNVKWDKIEGGCKWIGIGFGWNNWMAKDILDITKIAAIQMQVKSVKGSFKNLPVAFAFEDYSEVQCYYGYREELAAGLFTDTSWTSVTIPLSKFDFEGKKFDTEKVKQFIIQLEGDGNIYIDNIKFIKL